MKASRYLTHVRRLTDLDRGIRRDDERLTRWRDALPDGRPTIEFRRPSWFRGFVLDLLRGRGVAGSRLTVGDHPDRPFQQRVATADRWYVRLHYGSRSLRQLLAVRVGQVGSADRAVALSTRGVRVLQQRLERVRPANAQTLVAWLSRRLALARLG